MLFGRDQFDPWLILAQIVAMQCLYYMSLGLLMGMLVGPYVPRLTLYHIFDWRWLTFATFRGWMVAAATLLNALAAAAALRLVVERAKKCLDFAATLHVVHLLLVAAYAGPPARLAWWLVHGAALAGAAVLGEWLCLQKELEEIPMAALRARLGRLGGANGGAPPPGSTELTHVTVRSRDGERPPR